MPHIGYEHVQHLEAIMSAVLDHLWGYVCHTMYASQLASLWACEVFAVAEMHPEKAQPVKHG